MLRPLGMAYQAERLERFYILGLGTFLALGYGEFNTLSFFQGTKTLRPNFTVMHEDIISGFA